MLFPEQGFKMNRPLYDEDKGGGGKETPKDPNIDSMTVSEARAFAKTMLESKQSANAEAKGYREELGTIKTERETATQKKKDEDATLEQKITERDTKITALEIENKNILTRHEATTALLAKGFKAASVELLSETLTFENVKDKVKIFEEKFKDDIPDPNAPAPPRLNPGQIPKTQSPPAKTAGMGFAGNALAEMQKKHPTT